MQKMVREVCQSKRARAVQTCLAQTLKLAARTRHRPAGQTLSATRHHRTLPVIHLRLAKPNEVLPQPPGPVNITKRYMESCCLILNPIAFPRPMKVLNRPGKLFFK